MEPLVKRLRRHESLELDEESVDFVREREKGQLQLKSAWEKIFAKYENYPDALNDEIEWETGDDKIGKIVVDRGQIRELPDDKEEGGGVTQIFHAAIHRSGEEKENFNDEDDSGDELAASIPIRAVKAKSPKQVDEHVQKFPHIEKTPLAPRMSLPSDTTPATLNSATLANPETPSNPIQIAQLPQIPGSQPVDASFLEGLNKAISEAVSQYTSRALQTYYGIVAANPAIATPPVPVASSTPSTNSAAITTTDPNWWFPSLPSRTVHIPPVRSSPIYAPGTERVRREGFSRRSLSSNQTRLPSALKSPVGVNAHSSAREDIDLAKPQEGLDDPNKTPTQEQSEKLPPSKPEEVTTARRCHHFSSDDDEYIIRQRVGNKVSWAQVHKGRSSFENYPLRSIQQRYYTVLRFRPKDQITENRDDIQKSAGHESLGKESETVAYGMNQREKRDSSQRQLLTPNSIQHVENRTSYMDEATVPEDVIENIEEPTLDTDQEDMELLSLANSPEPEDVDIFDFVIDSEDTVIPSIETGHKVILHSPTPSIGPEDQLLSEAAMHEQLLQNSPLAPPNPRLTSPDVLIPDSSPSIRAHPCSTCTKHFKTQNALERHLDAGKCSVLPPTIPTSTTAQKDELASPETPRIKRESATPDVLSTNLLLSTPVAPFQTPMSAPQLQVSPHSSSSEGRTSGPVARAIRNLKIRQQWAKSARKKGSASVGAKGIQDTPQPVNGRKRKLVVEEGSEDELAV